MIPLLLILTLTRVQTPTGDLLDRVTSNAQIVRDLKDLYRTYSINHAIDRQKDDINACQALNGGTGLNDTLSSDIDECVRLKDVRLSNPDVRKHVTDYLTATIRDYGILIKDGVRSATFKDDYARYENERKAYLKYVLDRFSLANFIKLTGPEYWQNIDKKNYVNTLWFEEYQRMKSTDLPRAVKLLEALVAETRDVQEWSVYEIELADDYVLHPDRFKPDTVGPFERAARLYRAILDKGQYSLYLFEAWAKWRCVYQKTQGESKTSNIPNDTYERLREQMAEVILRHIAQHPKDEMAINEFIVLATHDMLLRFGGYQDGNQNAVEFKNLFGGVQ